MNAFRRIIKIFSQFRLHPFYIADLKNILSLLFNNSIKLKIVLMKLQFDIKYLFAIVSFFFCVSYVNAQENFFVKSPELKGRFKIEKNITSSNIYKINQLGMKQYLAKAPLEFTNSNKPLLIAIPLPDGTTENYEIFESPILAPEIAAKFPEIKTYTGKSQNNNGRSVRISFTANGFDAIITGAGKDAVYFQKLSTNVKDNSFISYLASKAIHPGKPTSNNKCGALLEKKKMTSLLLVKQIPLLAHRI